MEVETGPGMPYRSMCELTSFAEMGGDFLLLISIALQFWFAGINAFLSSVPNGGLTTFNAIINTGFGFSECNAIQKNRPSH